MRRAVRSRGVPKPLDPATARERALGVALRALVRGPRTRGEIESALVRRGYGEETIAAVTARLAEIGYLDDALVADAVTRGAERKHHGSRRIALTLGRRGVSRDVVEQTARASGAGDLERARAFLARRFPGGLAAADRFERQRATRLLLARGFPGDVVRKALGIDVDIDGAAEPGHDDEP